MRDSISGFTLNCAVAILLLLCAAGESALASCDQDILRVVADRGGILVLGSGRTFQVDPLDKLDSSLWLPMENVLVCDGSIINVDENGEKVGVTFLRPSRASFGTGVGGSVLQGIAAAQAMTDAYRRAKAYEALKKIYGPISGDPRAALMMQKYRYEELELRRIGSEPQPQATSSSPVSTTSPRQKFQRYDAWQATGKN